MTTWRDKLPPVSDEDWASAAPAVRAHVRALESLSEITLGHVGDPMRHQELLETRIAQLEERLGTTSGISSKPPSSDDPGTSPPRPPPSERPKGGQRGRKGHRREMLPPEKFDTFVPCKPDACGACGERLAGDDPSRERHQVIELVARPTDVTRTNSTRSSAPAARPAPAARSHPTRQPRCSVLARRRCWAR